MLDHVSIASANIERSLDFYDQALRPLGIRRLKAYRCQAGLLVHVGFGHDFMPYFWIRQGNPRNYDLHVAFGASSSEAVDAFYEAAIAAGGRDNGTPGPRPDYHPRYYGAFVFDPDGVNVEAVHHGF